MSNPQPAFVLPTLQGGNIGVPPNVDDDDSIIHHFLIWLEEQDDDFEAGPWVRPSNAGKCARQIGFQIAEVPPDSPIDAYTLWTFHIGHLYHDQIQAVLHQVGYQYEVEVDLRDTHNFIGHLDGYSPETEEVLEIKTISGYGFMLSTGQKAAGHEGPGPKYEHVIQGGMGAWAVQQMGETPKFLRIVYINKDKSEFAEWLLPLDAPIPSLADLTIMEAAEQEIRRQEGINRRVADGMLPLRHIPVWGKVLDPPAEGTKGQPWNCRYCQWQPTCAKLPVEAVEIERALHLQGDPGGNVL